MRYVLDTNIVSLIVRRDFQVISSFQSVITAQDALIGCPVVWFEVRRGLLAKDTKSQMKRFEALFSAFIWQDYQMNDWHLAAEWWVKRRVAGLPITDADLLIAAFTHNQNAVLVTDNEKDFRGLDVTIQNWANKIT